MRALPGCKLLPVDLDQPTLCNCFADSVANTAPPARFKPRSFMHFRMPEQPAPRA